MGRVGRAPSGLVARTPNAMRRLGRCVGRLLEAGDFVGLVGPLGAGKTVFARGVAEGARVPASDVASPSFAIVYPYEGRIRLYHADLYRVADVDELVATGFFDLVGSDGALLVEWIDRVPEAVPPDRLVVTIRGAGEGARRLRLDAVGERASSLARALARCGAAPQRMAGVRASRRRSERGPG